MDGSGDQLLARTRLPLDPDRGVRGSDTADLVEHGSERGAPADDFLVGLSAGVGGIGGWNFSFSYDGNNNITSRVMDHFAVFNNTLDLTAATNSSLLLHEIATR